MFSNFEEVLKSKVFGLTEFVLSHIAISSALLLRSFLTALIAVCLFVKLATEMH